MRKATGVEFPAADSLVVRLRQMSPLVGAGPDRSPGASVCGVSRLRDMWRARTALRDVSS